MVNIDTAINILKHNGFDAYKGTIKKDGFTKQVIKIPCGENIEAIFYPTSFIGTTKEFVERIIQSMKNTSTPKINMDILTDYQLVKNNVYLSLRKPSGSSDIVSFPYVDLEAYIYVKFNGMSTKVTRELMDRYGVDFLTLYTDALNNTKREIQIKSLLETIHELMPFTPIEELGEDVSLTITRKDSMYGAVAMLIPDVLKEAASRLHTDKIWVVPTSVHELIIHRYEDFSYEAVTETLRGTLDIVSQEEILSYHPYIYDITSGFIL